MLNEAHENIRPTALKNFAIVIITLFSFIVNMKLFEAGRISLSFFAFAASIVLMVIVMKYGVGSK